MQAKGLIQLCITFEWKSIAIVYNTGAYGFGLSSELRELADQNDIETTSMSVEWDDKSSFVNAAQQIKELGLYIIVFIPQFGATTLRHLMCLIMSQLLAIRIII